MAAKQAVVQKLEAAKRISGPFELFHGSFILEFLEPPEEWDATVLMRARYTGPSQTQGKSHPQSPPLHLHFDQSETFYVRQGKMGTTYGWGAEDRVWTSEDEPFEIVPWAPHRFWPASDASEDTILYVWAHPSGTKEPMDRCFFENLLRYISDVTEKKASLSLLQVMCMQHATASPLVMFPTAWWLGPLRWWIPFQFQAACAWIGRCCGYTALMREYTSDEDWAAFVKAKAG